MRGDAARGRRTGLRFSVLEITRRGMREPEMARIARLIRRAGIDREPREGVTRDVIALVREFPRMCYSFDDAPI